MAWGSNASFGQLGDGTTAAIRTLPVSVAGLSGVVAIACGSTHSVALKRDGSVWAWGSNFSGRLGLGTKNYTPNPTPAMVPGLKDVIAISAGTDHTVALKRDGTVWAWGENNRGQVGDGTPTAQQPITMECFSPVQAAGLRDVAAISAGSGHSLALKRDGTVWQWGKDSVTANIMRGPVAISGLSDVIAISSGGGFQHVLKRNGTVWSWGMNYIGQACVGTTNTPVKTPVQSVGLTGVVGIYAGASNSFAIVQSSARPLPREPRLTPNIPLAPR